MKLITTMTVFILTVTTFAVSTPAQDPRVELSQLVAQLQKTPTDNALREKIIKLAATMKPPPPVSDTALEFEGRARFAFKNAKSEVDYLKAAEEYEKAIAAAPWVLGYYSDICMFYEKANRFTDAKRNCEFYLSGLSDPAAITEVKLRIAGLKYGMEQDVARKAEQDKLARAEDEKRQAEQARRDVITKIKNIVNNRTYVGKILSYSGKSADVWGGVSQNDLFVAGQPLHTFDWSCPGSWRFFDDRVELWVRQGEACDKAEILELVGESWGPELTDIHWFNNYQKRSEEIREPSKTGRNESGTPLTRTWGYFNPTSGNLYLNTWGDRPLKDSEVDPNKRYITYLYKPL